MRRHGPVIAHCIDSEDFPSKILFQDPLECFKFTTYEKYKLVRKQGQEITAGKNCLSTGLVIIHRPAHEPDTSRSFEINTDWPLNLPP